MIRPRDVTDPEIPPGTAVIYDAAGQPIALMDPYTRARRPLPEGFTPGAPVPPPAARPPSASVRRGMLFHPCYKPTPAQQPDGDPADAAWDEPPEVVDEDDLPIVQVDSGPVRPRTPPAPDADAGVPRTP